jgi:hypothetical protein
MAQRSAEGDSYRCCYFGLPKEPLATASKMSTIANLLEASTAWPTRSHLPTVVSFTLFHRHGHLLMEPFIERRLVRSKRLDTGTNRIPILPILSLGWQFCNRVWQAHWSWVLMLHCHFITKMGLIGRFSNTIGDVLSSVQIPMQFFKKHSTNAYTYICTSTHHYKHTYAQTTPMSIV